MTTPAAAVGWRARELLEPAVQVGEFSLVADLDALPGRAHPFLRVGNRWQALDVLGLLGVPPSRRIIEVPARLVRPLAPDAHVRASDFEGETARPIVDEHGVLLGAATRARADRLQDRSDALAEARMSLRMLAHDGNNALALATMALEAEDLDQVKAALGRLQRIFAGADELADASPRAQVFELGRLLRHVAGTASQLTGMAVEASAQGEAFVRCSKYRLERVLFNLIMNARRARATKVRLSWTVSLRNISIHVRDDGRGIDPASMPAVLEPGFSTTGGRGLGLPAARDFARRYGGHLSIESTPEHGTAVTLELPRG